MYAIIQTGGKQYKVAEGDLLHIEKLEGEAGSKVNFADVLLVGGKTVKIGAPLVAGAKVDAEIVSQDRDEKIIVYKKKRRKGYEKTQGHRQSLTAVKITKING